MSDITVVLSAGCAHCNLFAECYAGWIEGDRKRTNVIMVDNITNRTVQDLLDVMRVDRFPAVLCQNDVHCGAGAFTKMRELTGIECDAGGGTPTRDLVNKIYTCIIMQSASMTS